VATEAHRIVAMKPAAAVLADAGRALLSDRRYVLAAELLQEGQKAGPSDATEADLAIATRFNKAESLEVESNSRQVMEAVQQAIASAPGRADLYPQAAALLAAKGQVRDAASLLDRGATAFPGNREILLLRAAAAELAGNEVAESALGGIRNRWPEWRSGWAIEGIILNRHGRFEEARQALETASALGESEPAVYFYLADSALRLGKPENAESAIAQALQLTPDDPWIAALAGKIALQRGDRAGAIVRLRRATALRPQSVRSHLDLAGAYRADGQAELAKAEEVEATRLKEDPVLAEDPPYLMRWFKGGWRRGRDSNPICPNPTRKLQSSGYHVSLVCHVCQ
jgi:tetratricopeptide (TPR) repeat protein